MLDGIETANRLRPVDPNHVKTLASSIKEIGLQTPISVMEKRDGDDWRMILIAGLHRLEALRSLGEEWADCVVFPEDATQARLWEISENLHRAELTVQERADHIAEWLKLTEERTGATCTNSTKPGPKGAMRAAERELGVEHTEARRAVKIASLPEEAKAAAREVGLDDNQKALLSAAGAENPVAELRRYRAEKDAAETLRRNTTKNRAIALTEAERFAEWLLARTDLNELPTIISWLEGTKAKDVIAALRREAA